MRLLYPINDSLSYRLAARLNDADGQMSGYLGIGKLPPTGNIGQVHFFQK